jgi:dihydrolipoamide dehydrogenase
VIGSGSAGLTVAIGLAQLRREVVLIESRAVGGDCTNVGCVPSKTLIHEASSRNGHDRDGAAALATVQHKRDELRDHEEHLVRHTPHLTFIHGVARFVGPKRIAVTLDDGSEREWTADNIVIATGSRPATLEIDGLPPHRALTNEDLFELRTVPGHLAIVGSGPIALEMAFAFRDLGARVSIVTLDDRVFAKSPRAASATLHDSLIERGVDVYYRSTAARYDEIAATLTINTPAGPVEIADVDRVLIAVGRVRNIDNIGLEHAGVAYDRKTGIAVDSAGRTSVPGIFAIGDVTPTSQWTHSANAQGRRVVQRIAFPWLPALGSEPLYPNATFSDPEVANVGLMPEQIAKRYHPKLVKTLRFELPKTDKGYTDGLKHGFVQVTALRLTGRILGATIVGPRASEMISFFTLAISENISLYRLFRLVYPYPTLSGAIQKVADQYVRETLPAFHTELFDVARYGAATVWQRLRGDAPAKPDHDGREHQPQPETPMLAS